MRLNSVNCVMWSILATPALYLSASGGSLKPENGVTVCGKGQVFEDLLPLEELGSIRVGAIVYPISGS